MASITFQFPNRLTRFPSPRPASRPAAGHLPKTRQGDRGRTTEPQAGEKEEEKPREREKRIGGRRRARARAGACGKDRGGRWPRKSVRGQGKKRRKNAFGLLDRVGGHIRRLGRPGGSPGHGLAGQPVQDSDERQLCLYYRTHHQELVSPSAAPRWEFASLASTHASVRCALFRRAPAYRSCVPETLRWRHGILVFSERHHGKREANRVPWG